MFASHPVSGSVGTLAECSLQHPIPYAPLLWVCPAGSSFQEHLLDLFSQGSHSSSLSLGLLVLVTLYTLLFDPFLEMSDAGFLLPQSGCQNLQLLFASALKGSAGFVC